MSRIVQKNPSLVDELETAKILHELRRNINFPSQQIGPYSNWVSTKNTIESSRKRKLSTLQPLSLGDETVLRRAVSPSSSVEDNSSLFFENGIGKLIPQKINPLRPPPQLRNIPVNDPFTISNLKSPISPMILSEIRPKPKQVQNNNIISPISLPCNFPLALNQRMLIQILNNPMINMGNFLPLCVETQSQHAMIPRNVSLQYPGTSSVSSTIKSTKHSCDLSSSMISQNQIKDQFISHKLQDNLIIKKIAVPNERNRKICRMDGCEASAARRTPYCSNHCGPRRCEHEGCTKCAQGRTRFCIAHGGGRRCQFEGCTKGARDKQFCAFHGGGRRCNVKLCTKLAVGRGSTCTAHGGGRRCKQTECKKSAQSSSNFCVRHGGGRKCKVANCRRVARGKCGLCMSHSSRQG